MCLIQATCSASLAALAAFTKAVDWAA